MIFSKCRTIETTCKEYVHPWSDSCTYASLALLPSCIKESLRIYIAAYSLNLILKGRAPTKKELRNTIYGIIQSSIFLTSHGVGYSAALCILRMILGNFNFYTVSFLPSFLSSILSILIERPSRRSLLSLYVTNVASETVFKMLVSRGLIKPIRYGEVLIFATSVSYLLYLYKGYGLHKDPVHSLIRFLVGKNEENGYIKQDENYFSEDCSDRKLKSSSASFLKPLARWQQEKLLKLKSFSLHPSCPHYFSCVHYVLSGGLDKFLKGYILQIAIKLVINSKRIYKKPSLLISIPLRKESFNLGLCFGLFTTLFRAVSCSLRRHLGHDKNSVALPAGFIAGLSFYFYRDNTIALYFMWKTLQICYNMATEAGYVPELPWAPVFFHALSTAILFHVAIVEPLNLRPSYWNFLQAMSGERIAKMDRICIDKFGLETSKSLAIVLAKSRK